MKTAQIESNNYDNNRLLRAAGVRRIFSGWYTVHYRGPRLDPGTICAARRNRGGCIRTAPPVVTP